MITCWQSLYRPADGIPMADRAIIERVKAPLYYEKKADVPRWSGAEFYQSYRRLEGWRCSWWIVLDLDHGAAAEQIGGTFANWRGFAHTTWSGGWRIAGQLARAVDDLDDWGRLWRAGAAVAERAGLVPDYSAKDACRAWALPARRDGDWYQHLELTGPLFDVEKALAEIPKSHTLRGPKVGRRHANYAHLLERAAAYLARMPGGIQGAGGSKTTFLAALAMVCGFWLADRPGDGSTP